MSQRATFEVDISDPSSVRARIAELDALIAEKKAAFKAAQADLMYWTQMRKRLGVLAGEPSPVGKAVRAGASAAATLVVAAGANLSIQQQTEMWVNQLGRPVTAADILVRLPEGTRREAVNWALWNAAENERIQKVDQGVYAPLDYEPPQLVAGLGEE
jgi:hypothetical protein